jgi:hypothetical protein
MMRARYRGKLRMHVLLLASALLLATGQPADGTRAHASDVEIDTDCNVDSEYDFHLTERSVVFLRDSGSPRTVLMRQGKLFVDDRWVALAPEDADRIRAYEREARAVMPLAHQVGAEAAQIAFTAIGEVAAGFSADPERTRATLADARARLDAHLARAITPTRFDSDALGDGIGEAIAEVVPSLVGDVVGGAIGAAFSGDTARLERMQNLDAEIEALVEPRARALEKSANELCRRMESLDRIDDALAWRLPDGRPLDLLTVSRDRAGSGD